MFSSESGDQRLRDGPTPPGAPGGSSTPADSRSPAGSSTVTACIAIRKGWLPHHLLDEGGEPVILVCRRRCYSANGGHVVVLDPAAERVGQQVFGEAPGERLRAPEQRGPQVAGAFERRAVVEFAERLDRRARVADPPRSRHVEVLEREPDGVDEAVAGNAVRVGGVLLETLSHREEAAVGRRVGFLQLGDVRRGRGRRRAQQDLHHPLAPEHRRSAVGVRRQGEEAPVAEDAPPVPVRVFDAAEVLPGDARDPVVAGQPLVHVRKVRREEVPQRAAVADQRIEEGDGLAPHVARELLVEVRVAQRVRVHLVEVLKAKPLRRKALAQGVGTGTGEHAGDLRPECARIGQPAARGDLDQLRVRRAAPQKEREPRRQCSLADGPHAAGSRGLRSRLLEAEDEVGTGKDPLERSPHTDIEPALGASLLEEPHQPL